MAAGPNSMVALIIPMSSSSAGPKPQPPGGGQQPGRPDNTLPGDLPRPENPIYLPLPPGAPVDPEWGIEEPVEPANPIVLPPGGSGGWLPIYIDNTLPGDLAEINQDLPQPQGGPKIIWKAGWTPQTGWVSVAIVIPDRDTEKPTPSRRK